MKNRRPDHYHVLSGTAGYMPDNNEAYETKRDALAGLAWSKQAWMEGWPEATVKGSMKAGIYILDRSGGDPSSYALPIVIELIPCNDATCRNDAGDLEEGY